MTGQADNGADPGARERLAALIEQALPGKLLRVVSHTDELTYEVRPADLLQAAATLRDGAGLEFKMCMDVCGVDFSSTGTPNGKPSMPRSPGSAAAWRRCGRAAPRWLPGAASRWSIISCRSRAISACA